VPLELVEHGGELGVDQVHLAPHAGLAAADQRWIRAQIAELEGGHGERLEGEARAREHVVVALSREQRAINEEAEGFSYGRRRAAHGGR